MNHERSHGNGQTDPEQVPQEVLLAQLLAELQTTNRRIGWILALHVLVLSGLAIVWIFLPLMLENALYALVLFAIVALAVLSALSPTGKRSG